MLVAILIKLLQTTLIDTTRSGHTNNVYRTYHAYLVMLRALENDSYALISNLSSSFYKRELFSYSLQNINYVLVF